MKIEDLKARLADLNDTAIAIQAKADTEKRGLTEAEATELEGVMAEFEATEADIKRRDRLSAQSEKLTASAGRKTTQTADDSLPAKDIRTPLASASERGRWGWRNFGDFTAAVRKASAGNEVDQRLQNAALSTYGSEGIGADGGYAVPPEFRTAIMEKVAGEDSLLSRCDQNPVGGNSLTVPKDETTPWGTAGIQGYWGGEASTGTQKKPALEETTIKVQKLTALVPVTEELLEDAPAMGNYVQRRAATVLDFKVTDAIINGTGSGMPLGILNAGCLVTQAAEGSQVADTIHGLNLIKMWARMPAASRRNGIWLIHPDAEPQLMQAGLQIGPAAAGTATGGQLVWMPPGGISGSPYSSLFGRPVIPTQACPALGDVGDILFVDLNQYAAVLKAGGLKSDASIHLWFDQGMTAFRFVLRMGGQPWWSTAIAAKNGSTTYSPFVALAAR